MSTPEVNRMRIAFDATTLRPPQTGVGYYTEHLLTQLLKEDTNNEYHLISNRRIETSLPLPLRARIVTEPGFPVRSFWMQVQAPRLLRRLRPDVAHFTNSVAPLRRTVPTVVTVHDMSLNLFPDFHPFRRRLLRILNDATLRRADAVITVSQSSKDWIVRISSLPPERVHVIYEAAAPVFKPIGHTSELEEIRRKYGLAPRVLLSVGTLEPRKNLPGLIDAFARLKRKHRIPHQLVLVGALGWGHKQVRRQIVSCGVEEHVLLTGYVPFSDLPALYNLAEVFVYPSFHEGFGLPIIEAMACGLPVVGSTDSSLREVAGEAMATVDAHRVQSIVDTLMSLVDGPDDRRELSRRSLERSRKFSWSRAARQTTDLYQQVASGSQAP
jgi:glycosyltransferase involved in cell wall biosynthesis